MHMLDHIRKLFGGKSGTPRERATTAPLSDRQIESIVQSQNAPYEVQQLIAAAGQSVGKQREHN